MIIELDFREIHEAVKIRQRNLETLQSNQAQKVKF